MPLLPPASRPITTTSIIVGHVIAHYFTYRAGSAPDVIGVPMNVFGFIVYGPSARANFERAVALLRRHPLECDMIPEENPLAFAPFMLTKDGKFPIHWEFVLDSVRKLPGNRWDRRLRRLFLEPASEELALATKVLRQRIFEAELGGRDPEVPGFFVVSQYSRQTVRRIPPLVIVSGESADAAARIYSTSLPTLPKRPVFVELCCDIFSSDLEEASECWDT